MPSPGFEPRSPWPQSKSDNLDRLAMGPAFQRLFLVFGWKIVEKRLKPTKKMLEMAQKVFQPAVGCMQHPKAGPNTQQLSLWSKVQKGLRTSGL